MSPAPAPPPAAAAAAAPAAAAAASGGGGGGGADPEALKALIATVPTSKEDLYAEAVDWSAVEAGDVIEGKLRPFIGKKMKEYLGEEEPSLVEHIVGKLKARTGAVDVEAELAKILDDDAEVFVMKLWRMLVFEMKARVAGLST